MNFEKSLELVTQTLNLIENKNQMKGVLQDLLTPQEIIDVSERIRIFQEIKKGETQRNIAEYLGISVTTVNRGSRVAQFGSGEIMKIV